MPKFMPESELLPRRSQPIFFLLDTSSSMRGNKISVLNHLMEEYTIVLSELSKNEDAELKIAVLEYNSNCKWMTPNGPESLDEFIYVSLEANGMSYMGNALRELNSKLSRNAFMDSRTGTFMPLIIFMTDGFVDDDYISALKEIRHNKWFLRSTKIGITIGDDADEEMLSKIVGNKEAVISHGQLDYNEMKRLLPCCNIYDLPIKEDKPTKVFYDAELLSEWDNIFDEW